MILEVECFFDQHQHFSVYCLHFGSVTGQGNEVLKFIYCSDVITLMFPVKHLQTAIMNEKYRGAVFPYMQQATFARIAHRFLWQNCSLA